MTALIEWVEVEKVPDRIIGARVEDDVVKFSRPHCPYPQVARYRGAGSQDDADNFECTVP